MYKCQLTGKLSEPRQKAVKIITKTRPMQYWGERMNQETKKMEKVIIATGWEIVEELTVLPEAAEQYLNGEIKEPQKNQTYGRPDKGFASRIKTVKEKQKS